MADRTLPANLLAERESARSTAFDLRSRVWRESCEGRLKPGPLDGGGEMLGESRDAEGSLGVAGDDGGRSVDGSCSTSTGSGG